MSKTGWRKRIGDLPTAALFLLPFLIIYMLFMVYPMLKGVYTSLCRVDLSMTQTFIGGANYRTMFGDHYFWESMKNTGFYTLLNTPVLVMGGLGLALIINAKLRGNAALRTIYFMPYVLSVSVVATVFRYILYPYTGLLNALLHQMNLLPAGAEIFWLKDPSLAWPSVVMATLWSGVGFNMIMFLTGLQEIDDSLYEAAEIDGAGSMARFWCITLPGLKNVTLMVAVLQTIASLKLFAHTYMMTKGGPGTSTRSIVHYIYEKAFTENNLGAASAMSYMLMLIMLLVSIIQFVVGRENGEKHRRGKGCVKN